jgi:hypothetical protein
VTRPQSESSHEPAARVLLGAKPPISGGMLLPRGAHFGFGTDQPVREIAGKLTLPRKMPYFRIRAMKLVRGKPTRAAAPRRPPIVEFALRSASNIYDRSIWARVPS